MGINKLVKCLAERVVPPIRVLLVDDNPEFLDAAVRFLSTDWRIDVVGKASSGPEAIRKVSKFRPDLVLVDSTLPGMDGLQTARQIKVLPGAPCVIVLTLFERRPHQISSDDAYVDAFITKSSIGVEIQRMVDEISFQTSRIFASQALTV
jgi:DNA-binding NarL/FixJ family response regulator